MASNTPLTDVLTRSRAETRRQKGREIGATALEWALALVVYLILYRAVEVAVAALFGVRIWPFG